MGKIVDGKKEVQSSLSQSSLDALLSEAGVHGEVEDLYPATPLQAGLLFHALHSPHSDQYTVQLQWTYEGILDTTALQQAWQQVIHEHSILRTGFNWTHGKQVIQVVYRSLPIDWEDIDLSALSGEEQASKVLSIQQEDRARGFSLDHPPLLRFKLIKLHAHKHVFLFSNHHILLDGWSSPILFKQVQEAYEHLRRGQSVPYHATSPYKTYMAWLVRLDQEVAHAYWQAQLSGIEGANDMSLRKPDARLDATQPVEVLGSARHVYSQSETAAMQTFVQEQQVTLNTLIQLAWGKLLQVYSGGDMRTVHGTVVSGRSHDLASIDQMVGLFINTLPVVLDWDEEGSISAQLKGLHAQFDQINQHSYVSLAELQQYASLAGGSLFHSLVVFENYPVEEGETGELTITEVKAFEKTNYPITLVAFVTQGALHLKIDYDQAVFKEGRIKQLQAHLQRLLTSFMADAQASHQGISLLTDAEYDQLVYAWNATEADYPQDQTLQSLFEAQVAKAPDSIALVFEEEELSYGELNTRANQVARAIRRTYQEATGEALKPDTVIALMVERSLEMVVGMLGVLKAGGAYVPIDPAYPKERIEFMLSDTEAKILLTQSHLPLVQEWKDTAKASTLHLLYLDQPASYAQEEATSLPPMSGPQDLAYVIYTSGSTGKPKGVMIEQHSVVNFITHVISNHQLNNQSCISQFSTLSFDASVVEIYGSLLGGSKLDIVPVSIRKDGVDFSRFLESHHTTFSYVPPSLFTLMPVSPSPQIIALLGESPNGFAMQRWAAKGHIVFNTYGPTETTVWVLVSSPYQGGDSNNIGRPISNIQVYVLDVKRQPVPVGVPGELYIGGAGVAKGYLNRPELTAERFIANPFASKEDKQQGKNLRLYKTGDLVKWQSDGNLIYLGRTDFQVKLRGYRIELGEIEAVLAGYPGLGQVSVVLQKEEEQQQLVAYYVLESDADPTTATPEALRGYLRAKLPEYMVPSFFVLMDQLPMTVNGKLDRKALPKPDIVGQIAQGYVGPRTEVERKLCEVWQAVLGLEQVGVHDNFFYMGGHSLLAIQLINRLNKALHLHLPVSWVFTYQNIAAQAKSIAHKVPDNQTIVAYNQAEGAPPLFLIHPDLAGAEVYYEMAKLLQRNNISIYGVNSYNIDHPEHPIDSFDQLTAYYAKEIIKIYPGNRLFLGGWSLGGLLSYGVYQHLLKQDKNIDVIFMIDTELPQDDLLTNENNILDLDLRAGALQFLPEQVVNKFYQHLEDSEYIDRIARTAKVHQNMRRYFKPHGRVNKIVLFKANESKFEASAWKQWTGQLDIIAIDSDHDTIMRTDNLRTIVKHIVEVINQKSSTKF